MRRLLSRALTKPRMPSATASSRVKLGLDAKDKQESARLGKEEAT